MAQLRIPPPTAILSASVLLAAACGGDDGERTEETSTAEADESTTTIRSPSDVAIAEISASDDAEAVVLTNGGDLEADVGGWQLAIGDATLQIPFSTKIEAGEELVVHRGEGEPEDGEVHAGLPDPVIDDGEAVELRDGSGQVVARHEP